ncbi:MAG: PhoH family protein [Phycisphaerales bacterium]
MPSSPQKPQRNGSRDSKSFVLDTNVLLHNPDSIFKFQEHEVVIPLAVIEELDSLKHINDERGRSARDVIRNIDRLRSQGHLAEGVVWNTSGGTIRVAVNGAAVPANFDQNKPANHIIAVANALHESGRRTVFVSNDMNSRVKCDTLGIIAEEFLHEKIDTARQYRGWDEVTLPGQLIDELYDERQLPLARISEFLSIAHEDGEAQPLETPPNHYLILNDADDSTHTGLARVLGDTDHLIPIAGPRRPVFGIMPRNVQQTMALDLLLDDEVKLVTMTGSAGTGKTLLAVAAGMTKVYQEQHFDKLLAARPIMPLGRDIGYLPGDKDAKLSLWMQPIFDNLAYLLATRGSHFQEADSRSTEQRIEMLLDGGQLVIEPLTYIRGRSIPKQFMIVDEVQNLSPHEVKTIVSRVGDGTKIVLTGDVLQIDNPYLDSSSNGLVYVAEHMKGQRLAGHISLHKSERSELASLAANLL